MKKLTLFLFFVCAIAQSFAANKYWIGGTTGSWATPASWSDISSVGAASTSAPIAGDDVYFENGAATVTLTAAVTVNSITFTSSNVTFAGAFGITTATMTATSSQLIFVDAVIVTSALTFAGTDSKITYTPSASGKTFTLGNGLDFTLTGNTATNNITGNINAYFTFNTTSSLTVYLYSTTTSGVGQIRVTKGLITIGNSLLTCRLHMGATNSEELILGANTTFTINGNYGSTFTSLANGGVIDASATGSKFVVKATHADFLSTTGRIFKDGTTINHLQMNAVNSGVPKTFTLGFPLTVNYLTLTAGTINNTNNNITIAPGGNVYTTNGLTTATVINPPAPTVTVTPIDTYTYNGSPQGPIAATNTGTGTSYTFSYAGTGTTTYGPSATLPTDAGTYTVTATVAAHGNYAQGVSEATAFSIGEVSTSINNSDLTSSPNSVIIVATDATLTIDARPGSKYAIYNSVGQLIEKNILNAKLTIPNSQLNAGVYFVKVGNVTKKVIIK